MKHTFQRCTERTEILSTFHIRVEHISVRKYTIETNWNQLGLKAHKLSLPLAAHWPPSNSPMCGPTPLTLPKWQLDRFSHNYATKSLVTIRHPKFNPQNCPFPFDDYNPSTPIPQLTPLTIQNGIWIQSAVLPQYTFWTHRQTNWPTDHQTNRWDRWQVYTISTCARYIDSEVLKIKSTVDNRCSFTTLSAQSGHILHNTSTSKWATISNDNNGFLERKMGDESTQSSETQTSLRTISSRPRPMPRPVPFKVKVKARAIQG